MSESSDTVISKDCKTCNIQYKSKAEYLANGKSWRVCSEGKLWFECKCGTTLYLEKGEHSWYSSRLFLHPSSIPFYEDEEALKKIPQLPSALTKLQEQINNPQNSSQEIAQALRDAPALAVEVLRLANNTRIAKGKIKSLAHAITYLGRKTLCQLTLAAMLQSLKFKTHKYTAEIFWQEAFLVGHITEALVVKFQMTSCSDIAYLSGCLCNIGKLIAAICYPQKVDDMVEILGDPIQMQSWVKTEKRVNLTNHLILGDIAAINWGFPPEIRECVIYHHKPIKRAPDNNPYLKLFECVNFANMLSHWVNLEPHRIDKQQFTSFQVYLGLGDRETEQFVDTLLPLRKIVENQVETSKLIQH